ncbi:ankyrin repeat-containing domain protein [Trichoderma austrokoningii]
MGLDDLPPELIHQITGFLPRRRDVNALAGANQHLHALLDQVVYKRQAKTLSPSIFEWAAAKNSVETARKALQYGIDPNGSFRRGKSALKTAVYHDHLPIVKLLLDHGALIRDPMILGAAAFQGLDEMAELLLDHGASPDTMSLRFAANKGHESVFTLLLERGADPFVKDADGLSILFFAVGGGCTKILTKLLHLGLGDSLGDSQIALIRAAELGRLEAVKLFAERGIDINFASETGRTALSWAAGRGYLKLVQYLLEQGASLDLPDAGGCTPVLHAAIKGKASVVEALLDHGADIEGVDNGKRTMLSWTAFLGHEDATRVLLDRRANLEALDKNGQTPLHATAGTRHAGIVQMLIDKGANVNSTDGESSPLSLAAHHGNPQIVRMLLQAGASTEFITTPKKQTPLFLAVMAPSIHALATVDALVSHGADIEARDEDGMTALAHATRKKGKRAVFELLVSRGAKLDVRDNLGRTLLMQAAMGGSATCIDLLIEIGQNVNDQDDAGLTALHHALMTGALHVWPPLLRAGADPEITDREGLSAYAWARITGHDKRLSLN